MRRLAKAPVTPTGGTIRMRRVPPTGRTTSTVMRGWTSNPWAVSVTADGLYVGVFPRTPAGKSPAAGRALLTTKPRSTSGSRSVVTDRTSDAKARCFAVRDRFVRYGEDHIPCASQKRCRLGRPVSQSGSNKATDLVVVAVVVAARSQGSGTTAARPSRRKSYCRRPPWPGPRGRTGHMSTTRLFSMTWYASYQFTVPGV